MIPTEAPEVVATSPQPPPPAMPVVDEIAGGIPKLVADAQIGNKQKKIVEKPPKEDKVMEEVMVDTAPVLEDAAKGPFTNDIHEKLGTCLPLSFHATSFAELPYLSLPLKCNPGIFTLDLGSSIIRWYLYRADCIWIIAFSIQISYESDGRNG